MKIYSRVNTCFLQLGLFVLLSMSANVIFGQDTTTVLTKDTVQQVIIDHADSIELIQTNVDFIRKLLGSVELRQDSIYMYCDSAIISNKNQVLAGGNVIIQQGDSLNVFADSLNYDGQQKLSTLYSDVVLETNGQQLFTDELNYDLNTKIATYYTGALLTNGTTQLTSKRGYFYTDIDEAYFKDSVVIVDPEFSLRADTLKFNTKTQVATFLGPTLIANDSVRIYCEAGYYDTENEIAEFRERARFVNGDQLATAKVIQYDGTKEQYVLAGEANFTENDRQATADTILYDEQTAEVILVGDAVYQDSTQYIEAESIVYNRDKEIYKTTGRSYISNPPQILEADKVDYDNDEGLGLAFGNVIWQDTSQNLTIVCEAAAYNRTTDYIKASGGRPLLITKIEEDSLYLAADTLFGIGRQDTIVIDSVTTQIDTNRLLLAFPDVRIFKTDLQAVCDSLSYSTQDSIFRFFKKPVVWSDTSQFVADTINMQLKNQQLDRIYLLQNSLIINSPDERFFNQIKGRNVVARFDSSEIRRMDVEGSAETIYYAQDESKAYVGVNKTVSSEMRLYFRDNNVQRIKFFGQSTANLIPMEQADHEALKLPGFRWIVDRRPLSIEDLFVSLKPNEITISTTEE